MKPRAAFVGLSTWDLIYLVDHMPSPDEKVVALDAAMNAGGPATNASVTFSQLGGEALLVSPIGSGATASAILDDLRSCNVSCHDISPGDGFRTPVSSAFVTKGSACRAVVSLNGSKVSQTASWDPSKILSGTQLLLVDGHYLDAALSAAGWAACAKVPVVLDAGSWKAGTEELLKLCDTVIASSRFRPPGCQSRSEVLEYLAGAGISKIAITDGERPIVFKEGACVDALCTSRSNGIDTTGAGDVFHGAFCFFTLKGSSFSEALERATRIAAAKCDHLGARSWLTDIAHVSFK